MSENRIFLAFVAGTQAPNQNGDRTVISTHGVWPTEPHSLLEIGDTVGGMMDERDSDGDMCEPPTYGLLAVATYLTCTGLPDTPEVRAALGLPPVGQQ